MKVSRGLNLPEFERPKFADKLRFPDDITALTAQNISELLGNYTKLLAYASQEHTRKAIRVLRLECDKGRLEGRIFVERPQIAHIERWKRDQVVRSDPRMFNLNVQLLEASQGKELAWMYVQNFERFVSALSRELSRKMAFGDTKVARLA